MADKKPVRAGRFVQFSDVDQELARRFKALCEFHGKSPGQVLEQFIREFVDSYGPHATPNGTKPRKAK